LIVGRRFIGGWFGEFGSAGIFIVAVPLPLALIRRSRRRRDGVSGVKGLL
jgi:hypothetical protein